MTLIKDAVSFVITELEKFSDPKRLKMSKGNFPTSQKTIGVTVPNQKIILKNLKTRFKEIGSNEHIEFAKALVNTNILECQHIAYEFIGKNQKVVESLSEKDVKELNNNLDNWVSVDTYSCYVSGMAWMKGIIKDDLILRWAKSDNRWIKRTALVSTVPFNTKSSGGRGSTDKTLMVCEILKHDKDDMVVKAMSWALRKLISFNEKSVAGFLNENENNLHNRIKREVKHKLETGLKN